MFLHKWALTSESYGEDLAAFIKKVVSDCGVPLDCPCDTCGGGTVSFQTMQAAIESQQALIQDLTSRIADLEAQLNP